jgi:hypothetical protein
VKRGKAELMICPGDERSLLRFLHEVAFRFEPRMVIIEQQQAFPVRV